jgi:hypothetical protein
MPLELALLDAFRFPSTRIAAQYSPGPNQTLTGLCFAQLIKPQQNLHKNPTHRRVEHAPVPLKVARLDVLQILVDQRKQVAAQNLAGLQGGPHSAQAVADEAPVEFLGVCDGGIGVPTCGPADLRSKMQICILCSCVSKIIF